jgi:hypothetical protein
MAHASWRGGELSHLRATGGPFLEIGWTGVRAPGWLFYNRCMGKAEAMGEGFRITYFVSGDSGPALPPSLPDFLSPGDGLEADLEQVKGFLRAWVEANCTQDGAQFSFNSLSINLVGPLPPPDPRTPEQWLEDAQSDEERTSALAYVAMTRFEAGELDSARLAVEELQEMLGKVQGDLELPRHASRMEIVRGRLALRAGDAHEAKRRLRAAGTAAVSPSMASFGPNMSLAQDLLEVGERQAVLGYFEACKAFWEMGQERLDEWAADVREGRIPDFGANLRY